MATARATHCRRARNRGHRVTYERCSSMNGLYAKYTGKPIEEIETAMERDNFMTADEAKTFGLIDEVFEKRPAATDDSAS